MAYRSEYEALRAQCDALQQELKQARRGSDELERLRAELAQKLAQLEQAKAEQLVAGPVGRRLQSAALWRGAALAGIITLCFGGAVVYYYQQCPRAHRTPRTLAQSPTAPAWFARMRRHCNPVEVGDAIRRNPAPATNAGQGYLATCLALAGKTGGAQQVIDALEPSARPTAARIMFAIAHPIADRGDDVAPGPVMELVLRYQPDNFMAVYHAGMSAHSEQRFDRAVKLLRRFLAMYEREDIWRQRAKEALAQTAAGAPDQR